MKIPTNRLCRLDGARPTARDRWQAWFSIYRAATKHAPGGRSTEVETAFRVILHNWRWLRTVEGPHEDELLTVRSLPLFLRQDRVRLARERRRRRNAERLVEAIMAEVSP